MTEVLRLRSLEEKAYYLNEALSNVALNQRYDIITSVIKPAHILIWYKGGPSSVFTAFFTKYFSRGELNQGANIKNGLETVGVKYNLGIIRNLGIDVKEYPTPTTPEEFFKRYPDWTNDKARPEYVRAATEVLQPEKRSVNDWVVQNRKPGVEAVITGRSRDEAGREALPFADYCGGILEINPYADIYQDYRELVLAKLGISPMEIGGDPAIIGDTCGMHLSERV